MNALIQWIVIFSILGLCLITLIIFGITMEIKWKKLDKEMEKIMRSVVQDSPEYARKD